MSLKDMKMNDLENAYERLKAEVLHLCELSEAGKTVFIDDFRKAVEQKLHRGSFAIFEGGK